MTIYTGINPSTIFPARHQALMTTPLPNLGIKQSNGAGIGEHPASYGAVTDNDMGVQTTVNHTGSKGSTYGDMFYDRIYIDPLTVALGQLSSEQTVAIVIFNGYLDASKVFSGVSFAGAEGIRLDYGDYDGPPTTPAPLQELHYTLVIGMDGPASIACTITWDFEDDAGDAQTVITGSRVVVWPLPFKRGVLETLEWLTDVLTGDDGTEQRISLRLSPRQSYKIESRVPRQFRASMDNLLYGWRHRLWGVPIWPEATRLTAAVGIGDSTLYLNTLYADYSVGGRCLIYLDYETMFVGTIADIGDTYLEIEETMTKAIPVSAWVMPLKTGRLKANPAQDLQDGHRASVAATFLLTEAPAVEASTPDQTYNDIDVEMTMPVLSSGGKVNDVWQREMTVYDFSAGVRRELSTWDYTRKSRSYTRQLRSRAGIWAMRQWLMRRRGKAVPFYQPTYQADLVLTDLNGDIGSLIVCTGSYHPTMGVDRVNLAFFMSDGSMLLRQITGSEASTDGTMTIFLDSSIDLARADIKHISYMGCKRLASDSADITWNRTDLAEIDFSITEIRP